MDAAALLMQFGLTKQESKIYCILCAEGTLTGYEAAKRTGISRSNSYTALAGLVEKGAACLSEGTVTRYIPVPVEEFCSGKILSLERARNKLTEIIPTKAESNNGYLTIEGEDNILNRMRSMIAGAQMRIYASMSAEILRSVVAQLSDAAERGLKVVLITEPPFQLEKAVIYHSGLKNRQIRLIVDSACVLTGDIDNGRYSTCLYSPKKNLVDLFKEDLKNEIRLIQITGER